jgi:diketogulonate reductase-like aldo/keto reductase
MSTDRRDFMKSLFFASLATGLPALRVLAQGKPSEKETAKTGLSTLTKKIPSTGLELPVIGLGTWITFNVGNNKGLRDQRTDVLREFFSLGGRIVDSSPMYGSSEEVIGYGLSKLNHPKSLFSATKVWTSSAKEGLQQIADSQKLWGIKKFDLFQVHNLDAWEDHLKTLLQMKEKGELGYVGVTTSHGRRHDELEKIMKTQPIDFVQLTYNIEDREVEEKLLPLAIEKKIAVIANRPYQGGALIRRLKGKSLPAIAQAADCKTWAEFLLKFVVSHPGITCAIPATSKIEHLRENMAAGRGKLPDKATREAMLKAFTSL